MNRWRNHMAAPSCTPLVMHNSLKSLRKLRMVISSAESDVWYFFYTVSRLLYFDIFLATSSLYFCDLSS